MIPLEILVCPPPSPDNHMWPQGGGRGREGPGERGREGEEREEGERGGRGPDNSVGVKEILGSFEDSILS